MPTSSPKLLLIVAHPDDAEFYAGGLATIYRQLGRPVKMLSVTDGAAGHHERNACDLIPMRRKEAADAGKIIGASYETLDFPDGRLQATLEVRHRVIQEIREFRPDLVLTHRTCDYHPDHRAVGQSVQDASYLVTVPHVLPEVPALSRAPVFAYMSDMFTRPTRLRADEVIDVTECMDTVVNMLACQHSQVFEWLPYQEGILETVPDSDEERLKWLRAWYAKHMYSRADHFREDLIRNFGKEKGNAIKFIEAYEISEYGEQPSSLRQRELFPSPEQANTNGARVAGKNQTSSV